MPERTGKQWFMELVVREWLTDPQLSLCKESTRGIWIDALCQMFMLDGCGQLVGTVTDLARLCRTAPNAMRSAIDDLNTRSAADVTERHEIVTLTNRRMRRAYLTRVSACNRQRKRRGREPCHDDVASNVTITPNTHPHPKTSEMITSPSSSAEPLRFPRFPCNGPQSVWEPSTDFLEAMRAAYPHLDIEGQMRIAYGWCVSNPAKRKTARGMTRFLNTWFSNAQNDPKTPKKTEAPNGSPAERTVINMPVFNPAASQDRAAKERP